MKKVLVIGLVGESVFLKCDHFHRPSETISCEDMYTEIGGKGFNQALAIKVLGGDVLFVSSVGNDVYGEICRNETGKLGLNHIYIESVNKTSFATILTDRNGNNQVSVYRGSIVQNEDLEYIYQYIDKSDIILLQQEMDIETIKHIIRYSRSNNKFIILNPAPASGYFEEISLCDLIIPNEDEVKVIFGDDFRNEIKTHKCKVIVTLGSKGALLIDGDKEVYFETDEVKAVDTTGAGDTFCGTIAYCISCGHDLFEAIKNANKNAGLTVKYNYVIPGILNLNKV